MKTAVKLLILAAAVLWAANARAATLVANQNANAPTGSNIYSTLQAAIDAASAGDVIHVVPSASTSGSPVSYGDVTVSKQLTILGNGINPDKDLPEISLAGRITLLRDASGDPSGTVISGMKLSYVDFSGSSTLQVSNVEIKKCHLRVCSDPIDLSKGDNVIIRNCVLETTCSGFQRAINANYTENTNITISNNVFVENSVYVRNGTVANNLFLHFLTSTGVAINSTTNSTINNNIFYGPAPATTNVGSSAYNHNLSFSPHDPGSGNNVMPPPGSGSNTGVNNINDQDPLLAGVPSGGTNAWAFNYDLSLQSGSPGKNAGTDSNDIGVFGGTYPWDLTPAIPIIRKLNTSAVVPQGTNLSVTVEAKSN